MNSFLITQHEPRSLIDWFAKRDQIDLNPGFQRRSSLWGRNKQIKLIDTILNGYDVPKLYLADYRSYGSSNRETDKDYAVIDGKQRLEAIFRFFKNELILEKRDCRIADDPSIDVDKLTYAALQRLYPHLAARAEKYELTVMSVVSNDKQRIRDMFVRLNFGVPVNGAERRNAMLGIVPELIHEIAKHEFFTTKIRFNIARMAEYNVAAKLLLIEVRGKFVDTKAKNLDDLVIEGEARNITPFQDAKNRCVQILDVLTQVFYGRDPLLSAGGSVPLYYWLARSRRDVALRLRPFLDGFTKDVRRNLELLRDNPPAANPELSKYYTMGRTTNDQASLEGRFRILDERFQAFLKENEV